MQLQAMCIPNARHGHAAHPQALAKVRVFRCAALGGVVCRIFSTTALTRAGTS